MMKFINITHLRTLGIVALLFVVGACSDDVLDEIGTNPNDPVQVTSRLLVAQTTLATAFETNGTDLAWYASVFVEHTIGVHGQLETADKRTGINSTIGNNSWNSLYATSLQDCQEIIDLCSEGGAEAGNNTAMGIAKVLMAFNYATAADLWGQVPFTEALQGSENRTPAFNSEEIVYNGVLDLLDEAIADLQKESAGNPGSSDLYFGGDAASWIAAANALKARYLNRISNVSDNDADILAAISGAIADPSGDMIMTAYNASATGQNPWYQEEVDRGHHAVSKTLDDILVTLSDPRRDIFFDEAAGGGINAAPAGTAQTDQGGEIYSRFFGTPTSYLQPDSDQPIITFDEVKFIEAEALLRSGQSGDAYTAYQEAITAAMLRVGVEQAAIDAYLAQGTVSPGAGSLTESDIITQKYIAFWLFNPIEAYNDFRRTRIPTLQNSVGPAPERFPYPTDEAASNPNVPDLGSTAKVWWAK